MKRKGIRILDKKDKTVSVELPDILEEIQDGTRLHWSILYLHATGNLGEGTSISDFEKKIIDSEKGIFITWNELNVFSKKLYDIMDILIIGCYDQISLYRYESDQEMYETCDIIIEMFDSSYWEVFAKDQNLINLLAKKFKEIKFLESDFQK